MRVVIDAAVAVSLALMPIGAAQAAKAVHKSHRIHDSRAVQGPPGSFVGNAAAEGNNANSMSGSNSAVENAEGRTGCC
jgi:hypothetical protein